MNRHFQAKHAKCSNVHIIKTIASIPAKLYTPIKTIKYVSSVVQKHGRQIQDGGQPPSLKNQKNYDI